MKQILLSVFLLTFALYINAAKVDTLVVYSDSMKKETKACVVTPDNYDNTGKSYPVLYLLHGYSGSYESWVKDFPQILQFADQYNIIIVSADGNFSSWYFDSPIDPTMKYETYISKELVHFIDQNYSMQILGASGQPFRKHPDTCSGIIRTLILETSGH